MIPREFRFFRQPLSGYPTTNENYFLNIQRSSDDTKALRNACIMQAVVHPINGTIYMVFPDKGVAAGDESDIFMVYSTDQGNSWSNKIRVNDDNTENDQWNPVIAIQPNGTDIFIGFYDRRSCLTNTLISTYGVIAAVPSDPASNPPTFGSNFRISEVGFKAEESDNVTTDYDQAVADNEYFYYSWTDERHPFEVIPEVFYPTEMDIRFAKIPEDL